MSTLSIALRLVFSPGSIEPANEATPRDAMRLRVGGALGLLGFIVQGIYLIPKDEINFGNIPTQVEALLNAMVGAALGAVLFLALLGFDAVVLGIFGIRGFKSPLYGSLAPFLAMPLACIPIHELFSGFLSQRGFSALVVVLIVVFLAWHVVALWVYLSRNFATTRFDARRVIATACALLALELAFTAIFLTQIPPLFDVTVQRFLEEYF
jgi:hypothetical protein